ncbi:hypothetical protein COLO4_14387 [Corchorus olitorius]|uniref:Uncharacterized protein n=1 Tax=Corchorus olitorius TaxID=93759 RepID=A0A1R3JSF0_9ROSI|nr:hypothetical protein COLO4_14387 [Corchorus olitorius]
MSREIPLIKNRVEHHVAASDRQVWCKSLEGGGSSTECFSMNNVINGA